MKSYETETLEYEKNQSIYSDISKINDEIENLKNKSNLLYIYLIDNKTIL